MTGPKTEQNSDSNKIHTDMPERNLAPGSAASSGAVYNEKDNPSSKPATPQQRAKLEVKLNYLESPGFHTVRSPVAGSGAADVQRLISAVVSTPEIDSFATALYSNTPNRYLINPAQESAAEKIALRVFKKYLARYPLSGLNEKNSVDWARIDLTRTYVQDTDNQTNTWRVHPIVYSGTAIKNGLLLPKYLRAYHELMHVEGTPLRAQAEWDKGHNNLPELLPTIATIVIADQINKELNNLPLNREVNYNQFVKWNGLKVSIGRLANFYRTLYNNYGSWGAAVNSSESIRFMRTGAIPNNLVIAETGL